MVGDLSISSETDQRDGWLDQPLLASLNWERALYLIILVLAIVSRLWDMGARVMSHDESLHTYYSYNLAMGRGFQHTPLMHGPFLFHVTALSYFLFGDNDFTSRLPMSIFGIALVMLPFFFRRELGRSGALAAAMMLLISPSILYHARYIRQETSILVWTALTALCIWQYLRSRSAGWLIGLAAVLAFHATDKSTSFLVVAMFVAFLAPLALYQLYSARGDKKDSLRLIYFALAVAGLMFGASILFEIIAGRLSALLGMTGLVQQGNIAALNLDTKTLFFMLIMLTLISGAGFGIVLFLRRYFGEWIQHAHDNVPAFNLIVTLVITTMFMGSPALLLVLNRIWKLASGNNLVEVSLLGNMANLQSNTQVITTMFALAASLAMIGVVIGVLWNWQRALAIFGVFIGISLPLFTTIFTNTAGIGTGYVGQLGYWMAQQEVMRGGQPWYYYGLLVPLYEYVSLIGTLCAIVYVCAKIFLRNDGTLFSRVREFWFPIFLAWWVFGTWLIFSAAGEKMPWLTVHFALPQILLTGWLIQRIADKLVSAFNSPSESVGTSEMWQQHVTRAFAVAGLATLLVLLSVRVLSIFGGLDTSAESSSLVVALANFALAAIGIGTVIMLLRRLIGRGTSAAFGLAAFVFLGVLTVRTAITATYWNYDYTREFLFYAHGAPGTKIAINQIEDLQKRLGGTAPLQVGYTQETSWPLSWYMRSFPGSRFFGTTLPDDFENFQVILASEQDAKFNEWADQLSANYTRFNYMLVWWPMEDYKDLNWDRVSYSLFNPKARNALWEIAFNRNFQPYSQLFNKTSLTPDAWSPGHRFSMFIRNDVSAQVWDLQTGNVANGTKPRPTGPKLQGPANLAVAPDGSRFVIDHKSNRVFRLDSANNVVSNFGGSGNQPGKFSDAWGIAFDKETQSLYVADTFNHRIQKFDANGNHLFMWGVPGATTDAGNGRNTQFFGPRDIAIDKQGRLLVTDTGNKRVQVFDNAGNFVTQFGSSGGGDGQFSEPVGLALDNDGNIYVVDTWNKRIQVFDPSFKFARAFPVPAWETMDQGMLTSIDHKPYAAVNGNTLFVTSPRTAQVLAFSLAGKPLDLPSVTFNADDVPTGIKVVNNTLIVTNQKSGAVVEFPLTLGPQ
jgi:predicted membrane-bound mannosyltransferase/DNA-binding beta-propeller fold protein YncE